MHTAQRQDPASDPVRSTPADTPTSATRIPPAHPAPQPPTGPVALESRAIWSAIVCGLVGAVVGYLVFSGYRPPLSGPHSVGNVAAVSTAVAAGLSCLVGFLLTARTTHRWLIQRHWAWMVVDATGLVVVHAAIAIMAGLTLFRLFQESFVGLTVDRIAGTVMVTLITAVAGYLGFTSASRITTRSLSSLLAVFMAAGMLVSMLLAENPFWWHAFFSELGTGQAGSWSFWTFNTTLAVSGLVLTTLARFITQDLYPWARAREAAGGRTVRIGVLRWGLFVIGLCMAVVGLVPVNVSDPIHSNAVRLLGAVFILMLLTLPIWLPGFPGAFYAATGLMVLVGVGAALLWFPLGYYNLTGFELAMAGIVYAWLVVFIRSVDAVVSQAAADAGEPEGSAQFPTTAGP